MSDQENTTETPTETRAIAVRERPVAQSPVAIWDEADFSQMKRVAIVLAQSGLVPESLCRGKWIEDGKEVEGFLHESVVAARCVLICNQARLWGADPLNVLQCTSLINGRLMYEGKLVNAVVQHLTGVKLRFELGRWDTDHFEACAKDELGGLGERMAIRCFDPDDQDREVSGSAGMWKTTRSGSPWSNVGNYPRQLRYRAAREWARAYEPGCILGILAEGDEELEAPKATRESGVMARLSGSQNGAGFDHSDAIEQTSAAKAPRGRGKGARTPVEPDKPPEGPTPAEAAAEAIQGDDLPDALKGPALTDGEAQPGEVYLMAGDEPSNLGRLTTYKDGQPFSSVKEGSALKTYARHPVQADDDADAEGLAGASEAQDALDAEVEEDGDPPPPELAAYIEAAEAARTFGEIKDALKALQASKVWKEIPESQANSIRGTTWEVMRENFDPAALPDPASDVSAFRLWVEFSQDADEITACLSSLEGDDNFKSKPDAMKEALRGAAAARCAALEE